MREVGLEIGQIRDVLISLQLNNRLPLRSRTSSAPAPSDSFPDAPGTVLAIRPCTLDNRNSGQRAMPNISDVPIDWANVDWLYVIVLSVIVFFLDPDLHIGFPRRSNVGHTVCDRIHILHLLSAQPAAADIVEESASSCGSSRSAPAQFAVGVRPATLKFGDPFMGNILAKFQRNLGNAGTASLILPPSATEPRP